MKESDQWETRTYHKDVNIINQISETDNIYTETLLLSDLIKNIN